MKDGSETTEYKVAKWIVLGGGMLMPVITGVTAVVGTMDNPSEGGLIALGIIGAAVTGVVGWATKIYTGSRTEVKVATAYAAASLGPKGAPQAQPPQ